MGLRSAERKKMNVLVMKCLWKYMVGVRVSRMDRVTNEEAHRRACLERELASRADQRMDEYRIARRLLMADIYI